MPDVIVLDEIWIYSNESNFYNIPGYNSYFECNDTSRSGGIVVYVADSLASHRIHDSSKSFTTAEVVHVNISSLHLNVLAVYRSPSYNADTFEIDLNNFFSGVCRSSFILVGDININILDAQNTIVEKYLNNLAYHGFMQVSKHPTRDSALLDHCFVRDSDMTLWSSYTLQWNISDHLPIMLSKTGVSNAKRNKAVIHHIDYRKLDCQIQKATFEEVRKNEDVHACASEFISYVTTAIQNSTTTKECSSKEHILKPYISPGILSSIRTRDKLFKQTKRFPDDMLLKAKYVMYRNKLKSLISTVKSRFAKSRLDKLAGDTRKEYRFIREFLNLPQKKQSVIDTSVFEATDSIQVAESFNVHFTNVGKVTAQSVTGLFPFEDQTDVYNVSDTFAFSPVNEIRMQEEITKLTNGKAPGQDRISTEIVKRYSCSISPALTHIFNKCIETNEFPKCLKVALVTPIFKNGAQNDYSNYRPISLLSTISKLFERIMVDQLTSFLERHNILSEHQFGFRKNKSCEDAVLRVTELVRQRLDEKFHVATVFLDLQKAFDTVNHTALLSKIYAMGIRGSSHRFITSYLADRTQSVRVGGETSGEGLVSHGVPQGSVLGPLLYLLSVNDIFYKCPDAQVIGYADDTSLTVWADNAPQLQQKVEQAINALYRWFCQNSMSLNLAKTKVLKYQWINQTEENIVVRIHGAACMRNGCDCPPLVCVNSYKYLGVIIDRNLSFKEHVKTIETKLRYCMLIIWKLRRIASPSLLRKIYFSFCQSHLQYCITSYANTFNSNLESLLRLQRKLIRLVAGVDPMAHSSLLFEKLGILPFYSLFCYRMLMFYEKNRNFSPLNKSTSLRIDKYVQKFKTRTERARYSYRVRIIQILNQFEFLLLSSKKETKNVLSKTDCSLMFRVLS
jgi:hypothetical protein